MLGQKKYLGILYIILSAFCFAFMNAFVRLSGDLPSIQKSFFRNFVAFCLHHTCKKQNIFQMSKKIKHSGAVNKGRNRDVRHTL